ncbi:MAG: hypothetical protein R2750_11490 [Bacteroidales bacterium]
MESELKKIYLERIDFHLQKLSSLKTFSKRLSLLRLIVFILAFILVYLFARAHSPMGIVISIIGTFGLFLFLIKKHSKILEKKRLEEAFVKVNSDEILMLEGTLLTNNSGDDFIDPEHHYTSDLDIFGEGSLFQFMNRSASLIGRQRLARKMQKIELDVIKIKELQQAVEEISMSFEWRQLFLAIGLAYKESENDDKKIVDWSNQPPLFQRYIFKILVIVIPFLTISMTIILNLDLIKFQQYILYLTVPLLISGSFAKKVNNRHVMVSKTSEMLTKYSLLLREIESYNANSPLTQSLKEKIAKGNEKASEKIKKLSSILTALDNRLNPVSWLILNGLFLWDILQMLRLENWQKKYKTDLVEWFEIISEMDALISLGNFKFNHPDAIFPELSNTTSTFKATELGHPLINHNERVNNDFTIRKGEFVIITGANMAGKSTFLRTIGINLILGMMGAPVCAASFTFKPISIFTSIRTRDSLQKNESYFYAELKRLKALIEQLKKDNQVFVILDEILKGTNSKDKHAGSEALLRQLLTLQATGIVATHDVSLGILEETFPGQISNLCFEVDIENDQLFFNYKLQRGVSKNMNATLLMRKMGITI